MVKTYFTRLKPPFSLLLLIGIMLSNTAFSQSKVQITGTLLGINQLPLADVNILIREFGVSGASNQLGEFNLSVDAFDSITLEFNHLQYQTLRRTIYGNGRTKIDLGEIEMAPDIRVLEQVEIQDSRDEQVRIEAGNISLDPESAQGLPSAFGDFSKVLATLPGVVSNNELSAAYSVRGGNFDENLVYVNDILVYRPFLIRSGQQEGLSFVNTDLVQGANFSSGGWQPKYGDKLSSSLNITYKQPTELSGSATLGTLGATAHVEGMTKNKRVSSVLGFRHKNSRYLLNTLDTDGEYFPRFTDLQSFSTINLGKGDAIGETTNINLLFAYSQNRYLVEPEARETDFGTFNRSFRLFVAFEGRDVLEYDTYQGAVKLNHNFNDRLRSSMIVSAVSTREREFFELEGGYRLCDLNTDPGSASFNECAVTRGVGTDYGSGRNLLDAAIVNIDNRTAWYPNDNNRVEFGIGYAYEGIDDEIREYSFTDSANFSTIEGRIENEIDVNSNRINGYLQHTIAISDSIHYLTYGLRMTYWDLNNQLLISPRIQYAFQPRWLGNTVFRLAAGRYVQPPFYRELRDRQGNINTNIKAQESWHFIAGIDHKFVMWGRTFTFLSEAYYKDIDNAIAYDIDDVRIRYFGNNDTNAYAAGLDLRVNGQFIPGAESWFSLGVLKTEEDIVEDDNGFIRRPSDQRVNLGIFFQDHLPNDPSFRVALNFLFGSGLPFGPPNNDAFRNAFDGDQFMRADLGLSKVFSFKPASTVKSLWIGLDVLNLFGFNNTISYTWITDLNRNQLAVPNALSSRFFNGKVTVEF